MSRTQNGGIAWNSGVLVICRQGPRAGARMRVKTCTHARTLCVQYVCGHFCNYVVNAYTNAHITHLHASVQIQRYTFAHALQFLQSF